MEFFDNLKSIFFISAGAVIGANLRFLICHKLEKTPIKKEFRIFIVNNMATFLFGFSYSIFSKIVSFNASKNLSLLFLIGLIGSMSSFSTFIFDLFELSINFKFYRLIKIFNLSIVVSLISITLGYLLGNNL